MLLNPTKAPIEFKLDRLPGQDPIRYCVKPGEVCEVPEGYAASGLIFRIAPGLKPAPEVMAAELAVEMPPEPSKPKRRRKR